jgi:hypothetical protein
MAAASHSRLVRPRRSERPLTALRDRPRHRHARPLPAVHRALSCGAAASRKPSFGRELVEWALPYQLEAETSFELRPNDLRCVVVMRVIASRESNGEYSREPPANGRRSWFPSGCASEALGNADLAQTRRDPAEAAVAQPVANDAGARAADRVLESLPLAPEALPAPLIATPAAALASAVSGPLAGCCRPAGGGGWPQRSHDVIADRVIALLRRPGRCMAPRVGHDGTSGAHHSPKMVAPPSPMRMTRSAPLIISGRWATLTLVRSRSRRC